MAVQFQRQDRTHSRAGSGISRPALSASQFMTGLTRASMSMWCAHSRSQISPQGFGKARTQTSLTEATGARKPFTGLSRNRSRTNAAALDRRRLQAPRYLPPALQRALNAEAAKFEGGRQPGPAAGPGCPEDLAQPSLTTKLLMISSRAFRSASVTIWMSTTAAYCPPSGRATMTPRRVLAPPQPLKNS